MGRRKRGALVRHGGIGLEGRRVEEEGEKESSQVSERWEDVPLPEGGVSPGAWQPHLA